MRRGALLASLVVGACTSAADWTPEEQRILQSLSVERFGNASSPGNAVADSEEAAALGERLFFDVRLSGNGKLSCASCHRPKRAFADGRARARGMGQTRRNTPTLFGAGSHDWFYWDGRRDSLWSQALIPLEAPDEMGGSRIRTLRVVAEDADYARRYRDVFDEAPPQLDGIDARANPVGRPADRVAWEAIPRAQRDAINRAFANVGKALAAFERRLRPSVTRFDRFVAALGRDEEKASSLLTPLERRGLRLFIDARRTRCLDCHNGPMFTNGSFHNIGTGRFNGPELDHGRALGVMAVRLDPFNCTGKYSDASAEACSALRFLNTSHVDGKGAFKVPTLRYLAKTAPYMHDGRFTTLDGVVDHYVRAEPDALGQSELKPLSLSPDDRAALVAFLLALTPED